MTGTVTRRIEVTADDIAIGLRRHAGFCPIACAMRRELGVPVSVAPDFVDFGGTSVALPDAAQAFIKAFDNAKDVQPFTFEVDV